MQRMTYSALAVLVILTSSAIDAAAEPKKIDRCTAITEPGSYVVTRNLSAAGNCLEVFAESVTIDGGGFVMTGNGSGAGVIAVFTSGKEITIRNGTIRNFLTALELHRTTGTVVERIRAVDNSGSGIVTGPAATVRDSVTLNNGIQGISVAQGSIVAGNVVRGQHFGIIATCPVLILGNASTGNAVNLLLEDFDGVCTVDHNVIGP